MRHHLLFKFNSITAEMAAIAWLRAARAPDAAQAFKVHFFIANLPLFGV